MARHAANHLTGFPQKWEAAGARCARRLPTKMGRKPMLRGGR
jgi:hypothetical protein